MTQAKRPTPELHSSDPRRVPAPGCRLEKRRPSDQLCSAITNSAGSESAGIVPK